MMNQVVNSIEVKVNLAEVERATSSVLNRVAMQALRTIEVGVECATFMEDGTFLEIQDLNEMFELGLTPADTHKVFLGENVKQVYELETDKRYVVAHLDGGSDYTQSGVEHIGYEGLTKEDVEVLVLKNFEDYQESYLLIYEEESAIDIPTYIQSFATEVVTFAWALDEDFEADDDYHDPRLCVFYVPTDWLIKLLSDWSIFKEYVKGNQIDLEWFDTYTHGDGYEIMQWAKEENCLLYSYVGNAYFND